MADKNTRYIGENLIKEIDTFYSQNADMDASGSFNIQPVLRASKKLRLLLDGDYKSLWEMEQEEVATLKDELQVMHAAHDDIVKNVEESCHSGLYEDIASLRKRLVIMTRCAKYLLACFKNEADTRASSDTDR